MVFFVFGIFSIVLLKSDHIWCDNTFDTNNDWNALGFSISGPVNVCPMGLSCGLLFPNDGYAEIYRNDGDGSEYKDIVLSFKWYLSVRFLADSHHFSIQYICDESVSNWITLTNYTGPDNFVNIETLNLPEMCNYKRNIGVKLYVEGQVGAGVYIKDVCLNGTKSTLVLSSPQTIFCETDFANIDDWEDHGDLRSATSNAGCPQGLSYGGDCGRIDTGDGQTTTSGSIWRYGNGIGLHYIFVTFTYQASTGFDMNDRIEVQSACDTGWITFGRIFNVQSGVTDTRTFRLPYYCSNHDHIGIKIIIYQDNERVYFNDVCLKGYIISGTAMPTELPTVSPSTLPTVSPSMIPTEAPFITPTVSPSTSGTSSPTCPSTYSLIPILRL